MFGGRDVPVTSIKGAIGEFGAAGAGSAAAAILCGRQGAIAPTVGFQTPAADCPVNVVSDARACCRSTGPAGSIALINSFASGGTQLLGHPSPDSRLSAVTPGAPGTTI